MFIAVGVVALFVMSDDVFPAMSMIPRASRFRDRLTWNSDKPMNFRHVAFGNHLFADRRGADCCVGFQQDGRRADADLRPGDHRRHVHPHAFLFQRFDYRRARHSAGLGHEAHGIKLPWIARLEHLLPPRVRRHQLAAGRADRLHQHAGDARLLEHRRSTSRATASCSCCSRRACWACSWRSTSSCSTSSGK